MMWTSVSKVMFHLANSAQSKSQKSLQIVCIQGQYCAELCYIQSLSVVHLFVILWTVTCQASLRIEAKSVIRKHLHKILLSDWHILVTQGHIPASGWLMYRNIDESCIQITYQKG